MTADPSAIYRWDADECEFRFFQSIPTQAATDVTFFQITFSGAVFSCFVIANSYDGETSHVQSDIYCWEFYEQNQTFQKTQSIQVKF